MHQRRCPVSYDSRRRAANYRGSAVVLTACNAGGDGSRSSVLLVDNGMNTIPRQRYNKLTGPG